MRKIIENIEKQIEKLKEIVEGREVYFIGRNEKWQDSEKGEDYAYETEQINEAIDYLENALENLRN